MPNSNDDGVINLRKESNSFDEPEFRIEKVPHNENAEISGAALSELESTAMKSYDKVKVKFDKFVNLVATHAYEDIFEKHAHEDVIISTDLLTDLANAHEEPTEKKKLPIVFLIGILLGIGITWLLIKS